MPDTMLHTEMSPALTPASSGIMDGYRSAQIGKLVCARARASKAIKAIVKDKQAEIQGKAGGRSFSYQYADLATVLDAIEDAISEQGLAILQTTQARATGTYLVTTLAHESDQWIAGEIRLRSVDAGPQVLGSEMTYLRRYAVLAALALAPEADDDGKVAQDRAEQQPRQERQERSKPTPRPTPTKPAPAPKQPASDEPQHMPLPVGDNGPLVGKWTKAALDALDGKPPEWRHAWMSMHVDELSEVQWSRPEYFDRIDRAVVGAEEAEEVA